ncbi:hypothetical protein OKW41_004885 [Paraburkholderia sp. UCT70]
MLSAKNISITVITGRMKGQPVVSESDMERLRECAPTSHRRSAPSWTP